jgi:hypothetical protein
MVDSSLIVPSNIIYVLLSLHTRVEVDVGANGIDRITCIPDTSWVGSMCVTAGTLAIEVTKDQPC